MTPEAIGEAAGWLEEAESLLARPESPASIERAVERLERACRLWPGLMACLTDRAAWDSLAAQVRRLERLAGEGAAAYRAAELISRSRRGYTIEGEPALAAPGPASVDCRG
jgi:hypothetical protein